MRALWERTGRGQRPYTWQDMRATLESMARVDWDGYHRASIEGRDPLPLDAAFRLAGLRLTENADGSPRVELDPAVSPAPNLLLQALLEGR
jgi:predicted metalloprotease with PDZ domain